MEFSLIQIVTDWVVSLLVTINVVMRAKPAIIIVKVSTNTLKIFKVVQAITSSLDTFIEWKDFDRYLIVKTNQMRSLIAILASIFTMVNNTYFEVDKC